MAQTYEELVNRAQNILKEYEKKQFWLKKETFNNKKAIFAEQNLNHILRQIDLKKIVDMPEKVLVAFEQLIKDLEIETAKCFLTQQD